MLDKIPGCYNFSARPRRLFLSILPIIMALVFAVPSLGTNNVSNVTTKWVRGFNFSAQKFKGDRVGRVCIAASGRVACLNGKTGLPLWSKKSSIPGTLPLVSAGPVVVDSFLVFSSNEGETYGLNLRTGRSQWTYQSSLSVDQIGTGRHSIFLPDGPGLGLVALDARSGKLKWQHELVRAGGGWIGKFIYVAGRLYTDSTYIWDPGTGRLIGRLPFRPQDGAVSDGRVYFVGDDMPITVIDAATGKNLWRAPNGILNGDVRVSASKRYVSTAFVGRKNGVLRVYAAQSGRVLWSKPITSPSNVLGFSVTANDHFVYMVIARLHKGTMLTKYSAKSGRKLWRKVYSKIIIGPVVAIGNIVLVSTGVHGTWKHGGVEALNQKHGSLVWKFAF